MKKKHEYIVRAVIISFDHLLVCRTGAKKNVYLPGGHIEEHELIVAALEREIQEELGQAAVVGGYLGAIEHAYTTEKADYLELNHIFECYLPALTPDEPLESLEENLSFEWAPMDTLEEVVLEPYPLRTLIPALHRGEKKTWWVSTAYD